MTVNQHFVSNYYDDAAQDVLEDLIIEAIQQYGLDMYYLPREMVNFDQLFGEDKISKFEKAYKVEFYIATTDKYMGEGAVLSKMGLTIQDEMELIVSIKRFQEEVVAKVQDETLLRPREGDIIFFAQDPGVFKITYVEKRPFFFQLGKLFTYKLSLMKIESGGEKIKTGIPEIDAINKWAATLSLELGTGIGNFLAGETVTQGTTTAEVVEWDATAKKLTLIRVKGEFVTGSDIVGTTSLAVWTYPVKNNDTYKPNDGTANKSVTDNEFIQDEATTVVDTTEGNPLTS